MRALYWVTWCAGLDPPSDSPRVVHLFFFSLHDAWRSNPPSFFCIYLILQFSPSRIACLAYDLLADICYG